MKTCLYFEHHKTTTVSPKGSSKIFITDLKK